MAEGRTNEVRTGEARMVDERESPSAGWREVCAEMGTDPDVEEATYFCPDCNQQCENVVLNVYECNEHGVFRASTSDTGRRTSTADQNGTADADATPDTDQGDARTDSDEGDANLDTDEGDECKNPTKGPAD